MEDTDLKLVMTDLGRTQQMLSFPALMELAAALVKAANDFVVEGIKADDVNAVPFEELSYNVIMALATLREERPLLFDALDKDVDGMLYSHASAHEFELMLARVDLEDTAREALITGKDPHGIGHFAAGLYATDAEVNEDDGKPQYIECDEQFSRSLMDQLAKDLRPTFDDEVPF